MAIKKQKELMVTILALGAKEQPLSSLTDASLHETVLINIFTATKEELERARTDLNNKTISQDFDGLDPVLLRNTRSDCHAEILNRLAQLTFQG